MHNTHYTKLYKTESTTLQSIVPLDARIVRLNVSVRIPGYPLTYTEELTRLYALLALTGTSRKSKKVIESYLRTHGLELSVQAGSGWVHFIGTAQQHTLTHLISLLREIIFSPKRSTEECTQKINLLIEANREAHDDARRIAEIHFMRLLYPSTSPFHFSTLAQEKKHILNLTQKLLTEFDTALCNGEWYVSVVGDEESIHSCTSFVQALARHGRPVVVLPESSATCIPARHFVHIPGKTNVELRLGHRLTIAPNHPDYPALMFGIAVLGKVGGFSGRLMSTVREKEGLTYGIYATIAESAIRDSLHWNVFTFFTARDLERGIRATLRELTTIINKGITARELVVFKEILKNQFILSHESNADRLKFYHKALLMGHTEGTIQSYHETIQKLSVKDVNRALRTYLHPECLTISGAGPVDHNGSGILG